MIECLDARYGGLFLAMIEGRSTPSVRIERLAPIYVDATPALGHRVKVLVVAHTLPWPEITGARMRLANVLRGLQSLGPIDLFVILARDQHMSEGSLPGSTVRMRVVAAPRAGVFAIGTLRWIVGGRMPLLLNSRDYEDVRRRFEAWARPPYDLAWLSRTESHVALKPYLKGPAIVDFDDLEDQKIAGHLSVRDVLTDGAPVWKRRGIRRWISRVQGAKDMHLWHHLHRSIAGSVDAVVVDSESDRQHLGVANAVVIPNGYAYQQHPVGGATVGHPPTIVFPGFFLYPPNIDAAHYLARSIAPLIQLQVPDVEIRLVGAAGRPVSRLQRLPGIRVVGFTQEIEKELARADIIAVPVRYGGGTRIKILEAFAHRIPVVSTSVGVRGIDAVAGRDLLVEDTPEAFATACVRLLRDSTLRTMLVDAAHRLFLARYRWDDIQSRIGSLGAQIAAGKAWVINV